MKGIFIALIVLGAVAYLGTANKKDGTSAPSETQATEASASSGSPAVPLGTPAASERFEYTITDFTCGIPTIGRGEILRENAKGHFCRVSVSVKNISKKEERLDFDDMTLIMGDIEYSTDSWVNIKAIEGDDTTGFLDYINPGLSASGNIFFDVPKDVTPTTASVDESAWDKRLTFSLAH
ncbi:DUF4352 domain-containing protein [Arthrobacter sp. PAMC25284]|uniref:DUF4352 domain-containing protein n=1 Tax=Arthrobacter sp. PAMC25284 TaxID=2861279 RepID=UPI001C634BA1|nr:DUF4352 domain-containing protein [Arthrobacter sp. PAMC25284]QYF88553.1 DUF4352 domain-containing protein [Arthrobacter sp. PAMC25284]